MSNTRVKIENLSDAIATILISYGEDVDQAIEKESKSAIKELVKATKRDAPKNTGKYRDAISSKTLTSVTHKHSSLWYVKAPEYRLAHLLNNGHLKRNGKRQEGDGHVTDNANRITADYEDKVVDLIKNG